MQKNKPTFTQRKASRLIGFLLTLCMLLSTLAPLTLLTVGADASASLPDEIIYREEFSKGYVNTVNASTAIAGVGGLWINNQGGSKYTLDNATLKYTNRVSKDYVDLRLNIDAGKTSSGVQFPSTRQNLSRDFTVSFWIKPDADNLGFQFAWKEGSLSYDNIFKVVNGAFTLNGTSYSSAKILKNQWSLIEIMYHYDETATAKTGDTGAITSYTFLLNGTAVATLNATTKYHNIDFFRMFQYATGSYELDDLTIAIGNQSLIGVERSQIPATVASEDILFEDFSDAINTSSSATAIEAADGFYASLDNGSTYTLKDGTLSFTRLMFKDSVSLQMNHTSANMSQDFILSYKLRAGADVACRTHWMDSDVGKWEDTTRINYNRIYYCHDYQPKGDCYLGPYIEMDKWSLVEIAFHYDEDRTAVTGEQGAFSYYTVMLNGELVTTVKTVNEFHTIDTFRLFYQSSNTLEIDDLRIATGNKSLANPAEFNGYEDKNYFLSAPAVTDYDYSICVVGDPQSMTAWHHDALSGMYQWIADNAEAKKMQFVLSVGDITQSNTVTDATTGKEGEWDRAWAAMSKMNGVVPYSAIRGNHDGIENFDKYFDNDTYRNQLMLDGDQVVGGFFGEDSVENFWRTISFGSDKYLLIGLDFGPTDAEIEWACRLVEAYPDHKVIITTHAYITAEGALLDTYDSAAASNYQTQNSYAGSHVEVGVHVNDGDDIWEKLGSKYENVLMIIAGHIGSDRVITRQTQGDKGNVVTQMLINPQMPCHDLDGLGMVAMLYFKEGQPIVSFEYYSTAYKQHFLAENQFSFDLTAEAEIDSGKTIVRHDFEDVTINTSNGYGAFSTVAQNGGLGMNNKTTGSISAENGQLVLANMPYGSHVDLQLYACGYSNTGGNPINRSFVLSFDIQIGSDTVNYGGIAVRDNVETKWITPITVNAGKISIGGASADLSTTEMNHVEIVFNYNAAAENSDSTKGAFQSVTLIVDGKEVGSIALDHSKGMFKYLNQFRMFQYTGSNPYEKLILDNLYVGFGTGAQGTDGGETLYDVDFTEPEFEGHTEMNLKVLGTRILNPGKYDAALSGIKDDILKMVHSSESGSSFIDAHVDMGGFEKKNLTVTMYVRPVGMLDSAFFSLKNNNGIVKGSGNTLFIGSSSKEISAYRFSCVEVVLIYDYAKMEYTTARLYVNGEYVGETSNLNDAKEVTFIRLATSYGAGQGLELDSIQVTTGTKPLYKGETTVTDFIGYQTSAVEDQKYTVRLLAVMTDENVENYRNVGFKVSINYANGTVKEMPFEKGVCTTVYNSVKASAGVSATYTAATFGGKAILALNCTNLPVANGAATFTVTTFYTPVGEETAIEERTRTFTVEKKEETKVLDLYLIGGQSNAAGSSVHGGNLTDTFENVGYAGQTNRQYGNGHAGSNFLYSFSQYQWEVSAGFGTLSTIGPEYGMAEVFNDYYTGDEKAFIFKSAAGGTALVTEDPSEFGSWHSRSTWAEGYDPKNSTATNGLGFQYYSFVENFAQVYWTLRDNGYDVRIKGMAWMQGEDDLSFASQYGDALKTLISDVRADLYSITGDESVKEMPFVIGKIATSFSTYDNPKVPEFNRVQQSVADSTVNCETIETADLIIVGADGTILGSDAYHFNYNDSRTLGNRFAQKLMEMNGMTAR